MDRIGRFQNEFGTVKPIIGVVHVKSLPGSPNYGGSMERVIEAAIADARTLSDGGAHALIVENLHDYPFYPETTEPETVAGMTLVAKSIRDSVRIPLGVQVLRNSYKSSLAIAYVIGAKFIRLNILTDAVVADQGIIQGVAHLALRYRKFLGAESVRIFADLYSKHAAPIARRPAAVVARDMVYRGMADAVIVSGDESSDPPTVEQLREVKAAIPGVPVIIGSGMQPHHVSLLNIADGTIFGFGAHKDLDSDAPVDLENVRNMASAVRSLPAGVAHADAP